MVQHSQPNKNYFACGLISILIILTVLVGMNTCRKEEPNIEQVGVAGENRTVLPVNQVLMPTGTQIPLPGPQSRHID